MRTFSGLAGALLAAIFVGTCPAQAVEAPPLQLAAQDVCTDIKMPWHTVDPCAGRPREAPQPAQAPPARREGACTEIKMPWHTVDPCAGQAAQNQPVAQQNDPAPGRRPGCTEIKMPWHSVDPCAVQAGPAAGPVNQAPARPPAPRPAPALTPTTAGLKVGDVVEFDRFSDGRWGRFGTIMRLNGDPNSPCPSYHVQEAGGGVTLSYVCSRVRRTTQAQVDAQVAADQPKAATGAPALGHYFCTYGANRPQLLGPGRNFWLRAGGRYAADDGAAGGYSFDAASGRISFRGGFFGRLGAVGEFKGGRSSQIDIHPPNGVLSYCSLQ